MTAPAHKKSILSIDGGGIRGIIPACTLVALEQQLGKPVRDCFDFVAGTSTGALIAAAVVAGVPAVQILDIYKKRSKEIFSPSKLFAEPKRLILGYMYDSANTRKVMLSELGAASTWVLNDSPIRILLTAKGIDTHPWYFVQDRPGNAQTTGKLSLIDCAVASASAPTYFKPWTMQVAGQPTVMVDGGVGVTGNPVYEACVEAFCFDDFDPANTRVISLGTGTYPRGNRMPNGLLGWLQWTVSTLLDAPEDQQTELVKRHWADVLQRFDWPLPQAIELADTGSIDTLLQIGSRVAAQMNWKLILSV